MAGYSRWCRSSGLRDCFGDPVLCLYRVEYRLCSQLGGNCSGPKRQLGVSRRLAVVDVVAAEGRSWPESCLCARVEHLACAANWGGACTRFQVVVMVDAS